MNTRIIFIALSLCLTGIANSAVIDFEDLQDRKSFYAWGIQSSYQGYQWGMGQAPGPTNAIIPQENYQGWASQTVTNPATGSMPTGGSGTASAWNWSGAQSLWIDFGAATDFTSGLFAILSSTYSYNASTVQLFGYDAADNLIDSSSVLNLTSAFQTLTANFTGIYSLEIRANANSQWFSVDDLVIGANAASGAVPEPTTIALMGLGLAGLGFRRKKQA